MTQIETTGSDPFIVPPDGAGRDVDEYKRATARNFRHILMNCTLLLTLTGLRQRLPDPLPELPRDQRDLRRI
jgi:hypothetical protein